MSSSFATKRGSCPASVYGSPKHNPAAQKGSATAVPSRRSSSFIPTTDRTDRFALSILSVRDVTLGLSLALKADMVENADDVTTCLDGQPHCLHLDERQLPTSPRLFSTSAQHLQMPHVQEIHAFVLKVVQHAALDGDCLITSLIFLERAVANGLKLWSNNWRLSILTSLIIATKVLCDDLVFNEDFVGVLPVSLRDLQAAEGCLLELMTWDTSISSMSFMQYYMALRECLQEMQELHFVSPQDRAFLWQWEHGDAKKQAPKTSQSFKQSRPSFQAWQSDTTSTSFKEQLLQTGSPPRATFPSAVTSPVSETRRMSPKRQLDSYLSDASTVLGDDTPSAPCPESHLRQTPPKDAKASDVYPCMWDYHYDPHLTVHNSSPASNPEMLWKARAKEQPNLKNLIKSVSVLWTR